MQPALKLYTRYQNSAGERVRIALNLKAVDYEYVVVERDNWDEYRKLNPQGLLPTLEVDGRAVAQSMAILEYIEELHPSPPLWPVDPWLRAEARAFCQHIAAEIHAPVVIRMRRQLQARFGASEEATHGWYRHWFKLGFTALEEALSRRSGAWAYCFGAAPGMADLHLVPQVFNGRHRFDCDLEAYPLICAIDERCRAHPAFLAAATENQPDYPGSDAAGTDSTYRL